MSELVMNGTCVVSDRPTDRVDVLMSLLDLDLDLDLMGATGPGLTVYCEDCGRGLRDASAMVMSTDGWLHPVVRCRTCGEE